MNTWVIIYCFLKMLFFVSFVPVSMIHIILMLLTICVTEECVSYDSTCCYVLMENVLLFAVYHLDTLLDTETMTVCCAISRLSLNGGQIRSCENT